MAERTYKIRRSVAGKSGQQVIYRLTVPPDLAAAVPEDTEFVPELTDEGLLYRPITSRPAPKRPAWTKKR